MKRVHLFIYGDVIGVGFRAWTVRNARELGLTGWVANAENNCVELVAEAEKEKLDEMIKRCNHGPDVAWVEKAEVKWEEVTGEFIGFEIKY